MIQNGDIYYRCLVVEALRNTQAYAWVETNGLKE